MTKDDIIKALRDMAKYPTVTLPRDCDALRAAADLLAQPCPTCEGLARTVMLDQTSHDTQRKWVGLTPKEVAEIVIYPMNKTDDLVRIIEAKLKEKNEY